MKIHLKQERLAELLPRAGIGEEPYRWVDYSVAFEDAARSLRAQARALAKERRAAVDLLTELTAAPAEARSALLEQQRFRTWGFCELLVDQSSEVSLQEPAWAQELAGLALRLADLLDPGRYRPALLEDLRARAWAFLGNARRLTSDLRGAEDGFDRAVAHLRKGTGDPVERAILLDGRASLERDQRRFEQARETLEKAVAIFLRNGETHRAGRSLVNLSLVHSYAGQTAESIAVLQRALELIDPKQEPRLRLCARHNLAGYLAEAGRHAEALRLYRDTRTLYRRFSDAWTQNRRKWLRGRIDQGLGRARTAEALLRAARDGFLAEGIPYDTALVSLDLALLYAQRGKTEELKRLAAEIVPVFASRGIHREALAALAFLKHALDTESATLEILTRVADYLRKAQNDPELCWEGVQ